MNHWRPKTSTTTHMMLFLREIFAEEPYVKTQKSVYFYHSTRIVLIRVHVSLISRLNFKINALQSNPRHNTTFEMEWNPCVIQRDKQNSVWVGRDLVREDDYWRGWNDFLGTQEGHTVFTLLNTALE